MPQPQRSLRRKLYQPLLVQFYSFQRTSIQSMVVCYDIMTKHHQVPAVLCLLPSLAQTCEAGGSSACGARLCSTCVVWTAAANQCVSQVTRLSITPIWKFVSYGPAASVCAAASVLTTSPSQFYTTGPFSTVKVFDAPSIQ